MRIGIFIDEWADGGVPVFLDRLEQFLTSEGHEVILFLAHPHGKRDLLGRSLYEPIKKRLGDRCVALHMKSYPVAWRAEHFRQIICAQGVTCLLLNHFNHYIDLLESIADQIPMVSVAHSDCDFYYFEFLRSMHFTRASVSVSERIHQKTLLFSDPARAHLANHIAYGVNDDPARFQPMREGPLKVVFCARLDPFQKRCKDLVPIWRSYRHQGGTGELTIIGTGTAEQQLKTEFRSEIAEGKISMPGRLSSAAALDEMASGDVVLSVSNFEGLPQAIIEGASLGLLPLLSSIESGHREIIQAVGLGTLCNLGDSCAFAIELLRLQNELVTIRAQRAEIRKRALEHYSLRTSGLRYLEVINKVCHASAMPSQIKPTSRAFGQRINRLFHLAKYRRHIH